MVEQTGEIAQDVFVKDIASASNEARLALAQQLKNAGFWKGKISSKFDIKYYTALAKLEESYLAQIAIDKIIGKTTPTKRYDVLSSTIADEETGTPSTITSRSITSKTKGASTLDAIGEELLGRQLTNIEKAKYLKMLNAEEKKASSDTVTKYSANRSMSTTTTGLDKEQFLIEKIAGTDEAKANKVLDAYSALVDMLGGLR